MSASYLITQAIAAFLGTIAFSVLFHVSSRRFLLCGIISAVSWLCFLSLRQLLSPAEAAFFATVVVVTLSRFFAIRNRCSVTVYLIPGIFSLVPGAGIYWTAYYALTEQAPLSIAKGIETLMIAVAIVLGIVFISEIPQGFFRLGQKS